MRKQNFFQSIDWPLFYQEKQAMISLISKLRSSDDNALKNGAEWLQGILYMMDAMGDEAEKMGLFTYPEMDEKNQRFKDERYNDILDKLPEEPQKIAGINTRVDYLYRDGSNYKMHSCEVVRGVITPEQIEKIKNSLIDGEYFYPSEVGLPENRFDDSYADDPDWFEMSCEGNFTETTESPTVNITVDQLVENFRKMAVAHGGTEESGDNSFYYVVTLRRMRAESLFKQETFEDDYLMQIPDSVAPKDAEKYAETVFRNMAHELLTSKKCVYCIRQSSEDFNWGDLVSELTDDIMEKYHCQEFSWKNCGNGIQMANCRITVDVYQDELLLPDDEPCSVFVDGKFFAEAIADLSTGEVMFDQEDIIVPQGNLTLTFTGGGKASFRIYRSEPEKEAKEKTDRNAFFWME